MEPSYERPNTVAGLVAKHKELCDLRERYRAEIDRLTVGINALTVCIPLFDPSALPSDLRDAVTPPRAEKGVVKGFVLNTLREAPAPMTARQLAECWADDLGLTGEARDIGALRRRLRSCIKGCRDQGVLECVGMTDGSEPGGQAKLWAVKLDESAAGI